MNERTLNIVQSARAVFARYGVSRTRMGDIAAEAGVARQTVYNAFPGKDEVLRAVVRLTGEETLQAVQEEWTRCNTLDEKLEAFLQLAPVAWFEAVRATPDWGDLLYGVHTIASEEMKEMDVKWKDAFARLISDHMGPDHRTTVPLPEIIEFFYSSSINAKYGADTVDDLKDRLRTIKTATLSLLSAPA